MKHVVTKTYTIEAGARFWVGASYGLDYTNGLIEIDYVGYLNDTIRNSDTDIQAWLQGDYDGTIENGLWVGFHYTWGDTHTVYVPMDYFTGNIYHG